MTLLQIAQLITIYGGIFLVIFAIIGNGINILIFSSVRIYRTTPCTFYFLIASIYNITYITINLISRIVAVGSGFDLTRTSTSWCKIRQFFLSFLCLATLSCSCLATIDQYFASSQRASLRRFSNIKWAHRLVLIVTIIWFLHGLLNIIYYNISSLTNTCIYTDIGYSIYGLVYFFGLVTSVPILIMVVFAYLTYRNIHLTRVLAEQQADRQLIRMILIEIVLVIIGFAPYAVNTAYSLITAGVSKDTNRIINETFALTIVSLLPYLYYAGSCYMFLLSSSRFRRATKNRIFFWQKPNQVNPGHQATFQRQTVEDKTKD